MSTLRVIAVALLLTAVVSRPSTISGQSKTVEVYKSPTCGCCVNWVAHVRQNGFTVKTTDVRDIEKVKLEKKVPPSVFSCHTAVVDGYVIEGHVPASEIQRLFKERPKVAGLAVAGMPIGSPGMEGPNAP